MGRAPGALGPRGGIPVGGIPGGVDRVDGAGRADGIGLIGGRGIELVGLGRPLEITRDSPAGASATGA